MKERYTYREIMYDIPYDSLVLQYLSLSAEKKSEVEKVKKKNDEKTIDFLTTL